MPDASVLGLLARLVVSLGVVIGLMIMLAAVLRKRGIAVGPGGRIKGRNGAAWDIDILARRGLGRTAQVAIVRAGGRTLLLGITEQRVSMLAEADPATVAAITATSDIEIDDGTQWTGLRGTGTPGSGTAWKTLLDAVRDRTVRR